MKYQLYIDCISVVLDELGFTFRDDFLNLKPMNYTYFNFSPLCTKLFVKITDSFIIEIILDDDKISMEKWHKKENSEVFEASTTIHTFNICNPNSINDIKQYFNEAKL